MAKNDGSRWCVTKPLNYEELREEARKHLPCLGLPSSLPKKPPTTTNYQGNAARVGGGQLSSKFPKPNNNAKLNNNEGSGVWVYYGRQYVPK